MLNREETLSVAGLKTSPNSSDVDRQSGRTGRDLRVPVINMRGDALMPTTPAKAKHLLDDGRAKVVKRKPLHHTAKLSDRRNEAAHCDEQSGAGQIW